jgi:hypothetical protein
MVSITDPYGHILRFLDRINLEEMQKKKIVTSFDCLSWYLSRLKENITIHCFSVLGASTRVPAGHSPNGN